MDDVNAREIGEAWRQFYLGNITKQELMERIPFDPVTEHTIGGVPIRDQAADILHHGTVRPEYCNHANAQVRLDLESQRFYCGSCGLRRGRHENTWMTEKEMLRSAFMAMQTADT